MADYQTGIDIKRDQSGNLIIPAFLLDGNGAVVTSGTTTVYILELQSDGTFETLDFDDNTFKSDACTTPTKAASHQAADNDTKNTGIWTVTLDSDEQAAFTDEYHYIAYFENTNASPTISPRWFQWGGVEGLATTDTELTAAHGSNAWTTASGWPTAEQIDTRLSSTHGTGSWLTGTAIGLGAGLNAVTITLNDGDGDPANGQIMVVRNTAESTIVAIDITDADGQCEIQLDDGSYKVRFGGYYACIAGGVGVYRFSNPYSLTVSGTTTQAYTCAGVSLATGGLTFLEMVSMLEIFIINNFGEPGEQMFSRSLTKQLVNMGHQELGQKLQWRREQCALDLTADDYDYSVSLTSREWDLVRYYDDDAEQHSILIPFTLEEFMEQYHKSDTSGTPTHYARYGPEIFLYPPPDDSDDICTIHGIMDVADLSLDDETPEYPPHLHYLIVDLAIAYAWRLAGQADMAAASEAYADRQIAQERHETTIKRTSGRMQPPGM